MTMTASWLVERTSVPTWKFADGKIGGKVRGGGAEEDLAAVFEEEGDADGGDEDVEGGGGTERPVGKLLDGDAEGGAAEHGGEEDEEAAPDRAFRDVLTGVVADEGADHEDVGVREIDEAQDAVDHRIAERDQGVNRAEG